MRALGPDMKLSEFDYHLPPECIAQQPLEDRAASRMLVLHRAERRWEDRTFRDLPQFLRPGDCLALNDSKVFPARLFGHRAGFHGQVEVLLLRPTPGDVRTWEALVRPGRKMRTGERVVFADGFEAEVLGRSEFGERLLRLDCDGDVWAAIDRAGHIPLPPYIRRPDAAEDRARYQTVYARQPGSAAAPTAGLHFTTEALENCSAAGAAIARLTLHVGLGTFQPLHGDVVEEVNLHAESYAISGETAAALAAAARRLAVGTTSTRTLETYARSGQLHGETDLFIYPGFEFRLTDALLTNFHLPRSSLLMLVCAFGGQDFVLEAYRHAVEAGYRFYSYGDCMLVL